LYIQETNWKKKPKHGGIENIKSIHIKDCLESAKILFNLCGFSPFSKSGLFRHFPGPWREVKSIHLLGNVETNPLYYIGVKPQDVQSSLIIMIIITIIIHHELVLDRPVPALCKSLFKCLPRRLL
jgi:hypothetical protein